jgi:hypothetical protein
MLSSFLSLNAADAALLATPTSGEEGTAQVAVHNNNNHSIKQVITVAVDNNEDLDDCRRYVGDELKNHLFSLSPEALAKNLVSFPDNKLRVFRSSLCCCESSALIATRLNQTIVATGRTVEETVLHEKPGAQWFIDSLTACHKAQQANTRWAKYGRIFAYSVMLNVVR